MTVPCDDGVADAARSVSSAVAAVGAPPDGDSGPVSSRRGPGLPACSPMRSLYSYLSVDSIAAMTDTVCAEHEVTDRCLRSQIRRTAPSGIRRLIVAWSLHAIGRRRREWIHATYS